MTDRVNVLVTGGAGYIGSHMVLALLDAGYSPLILDDFSTGHEQLVPAGVPVIRGNVGDREVTDRLFADHDIDAVAHFAASIVVPESVVDPLKYYLNNTVSTARLIKACVNAGVGRFIFSSTAAVYGNQDESLIGEEAGCWPENPYGTSKLMSEQILGDASQAHDLSYVALRYFNVAGADPAGRAGQLSKPATHLIKVAVEVATGQRDAMQVFGIDYPTDDGTCIRDYIHVVDLAEAHMVAMDRLLNNAPTASFEVFNVGTGKGSSVLEVIKAYEKVSGRSLPFVFAPPRQGDVTAAYANTHKASTVLGWQARFSLEEAMASAWAWENKLLY